MYESSIIIRVFLMRVFYFCTVQQTGINGRPDETRQSIEKRSTEDTR